MSVKNFEKLSKKLVAGQSFLSRKNCTKKIYIGEKFLIRQNTQDVQK